MNLRTFLTGALLLSTAFWANAAPIPATINIHGQLLGADGLPLTGARVYEVAFFDAAEDGTALGAPITGTATLSPDGLFNIAIEAPQEIFANFEVWYSLGVDSDAVPDNDASDDVFPSRIRVHAVPFALQADTVRSVDAERVGLGSVDNSELNMLDGAASNVQGQIDAIDTSGIATNAAAIAQNTSDIADNTAAIATKANSADVYTQAQIDAQQGAQDTAIALKANSADVYTQAAADTAFVDAGGDTMSGALGVDVINEATADAGVTAEGVRLQDSYLALAPIAVPGDTADKLYNVGGSLFFNGVQVDATSVDKDAINDAGVLGFDWLDGEISDTLTIGSASTVDNGAFSAISDLTAESAIGTGAAQVAAGDHGHDLGDLSGTVSDAQVANDLTVQGGSVNNDSFSAMSDLTAESAIGTGAAQVAAGNHSHNLQDLGGAVTDAQVPDTITITEADTLATVTGRGASTASNITLTGAAQSITFTNASGNVAINSDSSLGLGLEGLTILNGLISGASRTQYNDDTAGSPAMTYASDLNTGIHRPGADQIALVTNGVARLTASNTQVALSGNTLEIAPGTAPSTTTNKLYNTGGNLFFNGTQLNGGGGGGTEVWQTFCESGALQELVVSTARFGTNITHNAPSATRYIQFINVPGSKVVTGIQVYVNEYETFTGTRTLTLTAHIRDIASGTINHTVTATSFEVVSAANFTWSTLSLDASETNRTITSSEFLSIQATLAGTDGGAGEMDLSFRVTVE